MATHTDSAFPLSTELLVANFNPDGSIASRNEAWANLLGETDDIWSSMPPEDQQNALQYAEEASSGNLVTNQVFFLSLDGRDQNIPILLHFIPVPIVVDGTSGANSFCVTVTGEVLVEPDSWVLSQTQRSRIENVGRMTLGLIHEINNILTNILGNFEIIERSNLLKGCDESLVSYLRTIQKAATDGGAMTKSIKHYIRNEKSSNFELLDLKKLIEDCISFTRPYWHNEPRRKGIDINANVILNDIPHILGSAVELKEVFINLITNAVQAMPRGGQLTFRSDYSEEYGIKVSISDTGNGISDRIKQRIFDPLFTTKGKQGTGMGLSIAHSIIQQHDARLEVDTALGQGTTFNIYFHKSDQTRPKHSQTKKNTPKKQATVLAVDDEPGIRNVLANLLKTQGHTVEVASSGYEALDHLQELNVDIVFTDHGMPGMNGRQLAQSIRQLNPDMPIVLVTGDTEFEDPFEDINAVIGKPFMLDDLQRVINELV